MTGGFGGRWKLTNMRFNVARDAALSQLERFQTHGALDPSKRISLIEPASQAETRRLTDEFKESKAQDQKTNDLCDQKGVLHTFRGPSDKESVERTVEAKTTLKGNSSKGEMQTHQLATLVNDTEPYHETYEFTKFRPDGISHVTITVVGDGGVGCGGIVSMAEFLSPDPGQSWRERTETNFLGQDLIALYEQGTYKPSV